MGRNFKASAKEKPVDVFKRTSGSPLDAFGVQRTAQPSKTPIFGAKTTGEEAVLQTIARGIDTAAFGIPSFLGGKAGFEIPEPQTPAGRIGAGVGGLLGFVGGGPVKVGGKVAARVIPKVLYSIQTGFSAVVVVVEDLVVESRLLIKEPGFESYV